jgi:hypothetical protein
VGAALAALPLALMSVALFGFSLPNLAGQSDLLTPYSIANLRAPASGGRRLDHFSGGELRALHDDVDGRTA